MEIAFNKSDESNITIYPKPIYSCSFCRKLYKMKHACVKHSHFCRDNPINKHKCFEGCDHLDVVNEVVEDEYSRVVYKAFYCKARHCVSMHSYIGVRRGIPDIPFTERMPCECDHYKSGIH